MLTRSDFAAAVNGTRTVNELNRVLIDFDTVLTPLEVRDLVPLMDDPGIPGGAREWLRTIARKDGDSWGTPKAFIREDVGDRMRLYSCARVPQARPWLLLGFTGQAGRLMLTAASFLQAVPADRWDVLMVSSEPRRPFLEAGQEERDLQRYLDLVHPVVSRYEHVTCIGVSSGARMSLVAAPRVAARRAIAIGVQGAPQSPLLVDPQFREIAIVHAAGHSGDSESAVSWQQAVGGVRVAVPGIEEHNVLAPLKARGELDPFLSWLLEGDLAVPPEWRN